MFCEAQKSGSFAHKLTLWIFSIWIFFYRFNLERHKPGKHNRKRIRVVCDQSQTFLVSKFVLLDGNMHEPVSEEKRQFHISLEIDVSVPLKITNVEFLCCLEPLWTGKHYEWPK